MLILHALGYLAVAVWAYMTAWFMIARLFDRADVIDSAWGLGFIFVAWLAWWKYGSHGVGLQLLAAEFVSLWGLRLSTHIFLRNRKKSEDYRYVEYKQRWGDRFWQQAYFRIFLVQGVLLLAISLATIAIVVADRPAWRWLAIIGFIVWAAGIVIEAEADAQLAKFVKQKRPGQIMTSGLWRYSRHPNYFGEITVWWGAALVAISFWQWWGIIGAIVISLLITRVSGIPPLEKHYQGNKAYEAYKRRTSVLVPLPPKR